MIKHHPDCRADYLEKPEGEPPQKIMEIPLPDGVVVHQCADCGAFEVIEVARR
jgi:hypothetical protein